MAVQNDEEVEDGYAPLADFDARFAQPDFDVGLELVLGERCLLGFVAENDANFNA
jgi:hypothetical protein